MASPFDNIRNRNSDGGGGSSNIPRREPRDDRGGGNTPFGNRLRDRGRDNNIPPKPTTPPKKHIESNDPLENILNFIGEHQVLIDELKQDVFLNAQQIQSVKKHFEEHLKSLNKDNKDLANGAKDVIGALKDSVENVNNESYGNFLVKLLKEDFNAKQQDEIANIRRELSSSIPKKSKENPIFSFIKFITPTLSIFSFVLLMFICFKFKIFAQLIN